MCRKDSGIFSWLGCLCRVWTREIQLVFKDEGVLLFFFFLPLLYPLLYTLIYNPEVINDLPVAVVDQSRTASSRHLACMIDATSGMEVYGYCPDMPAARQLYNEKKVYGIIEIPSDYDKKIGRGEQSNVTYYADMSLLLRYRTAIAALTDVQLELASQLRGKKIETAGLILQSMDGTPVNVESVFVGDPTQGFASFVMPGVLVLILQQSMILGIAMLAGGASERRRRFGYDPEGVDAPASATVIGKSLCYLVCYIPLTLYVLHIVPIIFSLPHVGSVWDYMIFIMPMLLATAMFGQCIGALVRDREASLLVVVFSSIVFLFLSGITWPRYAMSPFWTIIGDLIPSTWGIEGFIRLNSNGSTLAEVSGSYTMLWVLTAAYSVGAWALRRISR